MSEAARAAATAAAALPYWGRPAEPPRLVKWRENIVFEVTLVDGRRAALRLHRPGYQSRRAIEAELRWTEMLAAAGLPVPPPLRTRRGAWTARVGDRVASLIGWLEGAPVGAAERPLGGDAAAQAALMRGIGALVARLHDATDALGLPPDLPRPRWDAEGLFGERPRWGRFWENPSLSLAESERLLALRAAGHDRLAGFAATGGGGFGLVHADVLRENVLEGPEGLALIDFDDSGWGYRLYDLATALFQSLEEPALPALAAALLDGYGALRPLGPAALSDLTLLLSARACASAGWIATRGAPDDPRQRFYAERALRMAGFVLSGTSPLVT